MKSNDDIFDETTILLMWNDMRVLNYIILISKYLLCVVVFFGGGQTFDMQDAVLWAQSTSCENGRVHVNLL